MLKFPAKMLRSVVLEQVLKAAGQSRVVCFSSGNAADALRARNSLDVLEVGPKGVLQTDKWWLPADIMRAWPDRFDATPGHLPISLMEVVGSVFRQHLSSLGRGPHRIPTGSGETLCCLKLAFPGSDFIAAYDSTKPETAFHPDAPLNGLVRLLADTVEGVYSGLSGTVSP